MDRLQYTIIILTILEFIVLIIGMIAYDVIPYKINAGCAYFTKYVKCDDALISVVNMTK